MDLSTLKHIYYTEHRLKGKDHEKNTYTRNEPRHFRRY